ncbi:MAG: hypothetical protein M1834_001968 [Cirrosporium novae-zelandiae]|nr:MAG: hypothetical protein M1834_001968 [Cirrosporium novae-zelandiae]
MPEASTRLSISTISFASPISRGNWHYNGDLYVEVGPLNRHKRASVSELTQLLRPKASKSKSTTPTPADQVGHWYEAQLLQYGLQPSKTKAVAKVRLLESINAGNLKVPADIQKLERGMKKEFGVKEKEAKAKYKAGMGASEKDQSTTTGAGRKRKQSEGVSVNVNLSSSYADFKGRGDDVGIAMPVKKVRTLKNTAVETSLASRSTGEMTRLGTGNAASTRPKQTARRIGTPIGTQPSSKKRKENPDTNFNTLPFGPLGLLNGTYTLSPPDYVDIECTLTITLATPSLWGAFSFGDISGLFLVPTRPYVPSPEPLYFNWRGFDEGNGYNRAGQGWITFLGGGLMEMGFDVTDEQGWQIRGHRDQGPGNAPLDARNLKREWNMRGQDLEMMAPS